MKAITAQHYLIETSVRHSEISDQDVYPYNLPIIRYLNTLEFNPRVTFIVGENGSGKSTLLEALAVGMGFNAEGGSRNFHFATKATHTDLYKYMRLVKGVKRAQDGYFLRAESFYNVATEIERLDEEPGGPPVISSYGGVSLHQQSHGESFMSLMQHRFGGNGLYILDEPEAALSPSRQLKMMALMHKNIVNGAQFIIATHSPIIMGYPDAIIYEVGQNGLGLVDYEATEHYQLTKYYLNNYQKVLKDLLN